MKKISTTTKENRRKDKRLDDIVRTSTRVVTNENILVNNKFSSLLNIYKIANNINYTNNPIGA